MINVEENLRVSLFTEQYLNLDSFCSPLLSTLEVHSWLVVCLCTQMSLEGVQDALIIF